MDLPSSHSLEAWWVITTTKLDLRKSESISKTEQFNNFSRLNWVHISVILLPNNWGYRKCKEFWKNWDLGETYLETNVMTGRMILGNFMVSQLISLVMCHESRWGFPDACHWGSLRGSLGYHCCPWAKCGDPAILLSHCQHEGTREHWY